MDELEGKDDLGQADTTHGTIEIARLFQGKELREPKRAEVFLHEVLHQIDEHYGIALSEKTVRRVAAGLFQVIRDNDLDFRSPKGE